MSLPGLVVDIEARIDKLEKGLAKANTAQSRAAAQMERRAAQSAARLRESYGKAADGIIASLRKIGPALAGGLMGGIATVATGEAIARLGEVARSIAAVGDEARRSGLSTTAFQELSFVATQSRIPVDALIDGIKELNLRADEFVVTGGGSAAEAFKRLGYGADELKAALEDPSELMVEIIGRMESLDRAAQIRVADEVFGGTGGERFVELLAQGESGIRQLMGRAHEVGAVMDEDMIAKAAELDRKFGEIKARAQALFQTIVVDGVSAFGALTDALQPTLDEIERAAATFDRLNQAGIDTSGIENTGSLTGQADQAEALATAYEVLANEADDAAAAIDRQILALGGAGYEGQALDLMGMAEEMRNIASALRDNREPADQLAGQMATVADEAEAVVRGIGRIDGVGLGGILGRLGTLRNALGTVTSIANAAAEAVARATQGPAPAPVRNAGRLASQESRLDEVEVAPSPAPFAGPRPAPRPEDIDFGYNPPAATGGGDSGGGGGAGAGGGGGGAPRPTEFAQEVQSLREEIAELTLEAAEIAAVATSGRQLGDALEFARTRAELLHAAQQDGREITPELRAEIDQLAAAYDAAGTAADDAADRLDRIRDNAEQGADRMTDLFLGIAEGSVTAREALTGLLMEIAKAQLTRMIGNVAKSGGTAGNVFAMIGQLLSGGFADGGWTGTGGKYEPAGIVHRGEYVMSKSATSAIGVQTLDALHASAKRGYTSGGYVGTPPALRAPFRGASHGDTGMAVSINAPVTVNASGGTPAQNADLARQMAREVESSLRQTVVRELQNQLRPGNLLGAGRR